MFGFRVRFITWRYGGGTGSRCMCDGSEYGGKRGGRSWRGGVGIDMTEVNNHSEGVERDGDEVGRGSFI